MPDPNKETLDSPPVGGTAKKTAKKTDAPLQQSPTPSTVPAVLPHSPGAANETEDDKFLAHGNVDTNKPVAQGKKKGIPGLKDLVPKVDPLMPRLDELLARKGEYTQRERKYLHRQLEIFTRRNPNPKSKGGGYYIAGLTDDQIALGKAIAKALGLDPKKPVWIPELTNQVLGPKARR